MNFGVPNQKQKKEEKYPNLAVATVLIDGGKGTSRAISFNKKACELLKLDEEAKIAFSFDKKVLVMNADQSAVPDAYGIKVTKNAPRRISEKKTYQFMSKMLGLDNTIENEFTLELNDDNELGIVAFELKPLVVETEAVADVVDEIQQEQAIDTFEPTQPVEEVSNEEISNDFVDDSAFDTEVDLSQTENETETQPQLGNSESPFEQQ